MSKKEKQQEGKEKARKNNRKIEEGINRLVRAGGKIKGSEEMGKFIKKIELHPIDRIDN
jgi:hypothetical protein